MYVPNTRIGVEVMDLEDKNIVAAFIEKAGLVSAHVHEAMDMKEALARAVSICKDKAVCEDLYPEKPRENKGKIMGAAGLTPPDCKLLESYCDTEGIDLVTENIRSYPGGIDVGLTLAQHGIAETGTLVINSDSEEVRLASMLCETHVAVLDKAGIRPTAADMATELEKMTTPESSYTAFITGASRTADIERVLAMGVHGPLEIHIILTGGNSE